MRNLSQSVNQLSAVAATNAKAVDMALAIGHEEVGLPLMAAVGIDERLISFVLAKHGVDLPVSRHLVALWLLDRVKQSDNRTQSVNMITWLGAELRNDVEMAKPLARRVSDFLVRCAGTSDEPVRLAFLDLAASQPLTVAQLSVAAGEEVTKRLEDLKHDDDELTRQDVRKIGQAIRRATLSTAPRTSPAEVAAALLSLRNNMPVLTAKHRAAVERWGEVILASEEATHHARSRTKSVVEISVGGERVELGRLGQLFQATSGLFRGIGTSMFPANDDLPPLIPITANTGSFTVRASVDGKQGRATVERLEDLLKYLAKDEGDEVGLENGLEDSNIAKRLRTFVDAVAAQSGSVSASFLGARAGQTVRRHTMDLNRINQVRKWLELASEPSISEHTLVGTLTAADLGTGMFKYQHEGVEVTGRAVDTASLNKVNVGKVYQFHIRETVEERPVGVDRSIELLSLEVPDAEEFRPPAERSSGVVPGVCVPQAPLSRVWQAVELVVAGREPTPEAFGVKHLRNANYYLAASRVLGLLDREGELTAVGRLWARMGLEEQERQLAIQFELSAVGQAWAEWARVERLSDVIPDTALEFLVARTNLGEGTARTRARYIQVWFDRLMRSLYH